MSEIKYKISHPRIRSRILEWSAGIRHRVNSWTVVVVSLRETIRLLREGEVDAVIESAGGWAIK